MSELKVTACDQCGERTDDYYGVVGWVRIGMMGAISISKGRGKDRSAHTKYYRGNDGGLDFCSMKCLTKWFEVQKDFK